VRLLPALDKGASWVVARVEGIHPFPRTFVFSSEQISIQLPHSYYSHCLCCPWSHACLLSAYSWSNAFYCTTNEMDVSLLFLWFPCPSFHDTTLSLLCQDLIVFPFPPLPSDCQTLYILPTIIDISLFLLSCGAPSNEHRALATFFLG